MSDNNKNITDEDLVLFTKLFAEFDKTSLGLKQQYQELSERVEVLLLEIDEKNKYLDKIYSEQQETNNLLYSILESLVSGVIVFNRNKEVVIINNRASELLGISKEEAIGLPFREIVRTDNDESETIIDRQYAGENVIEAELEIENFENESFPVFYKASIMFDEDGDIRAYIHLFDDLTGIKKMEEDVRKNKNLSEIGRMAAGIAHEIRNPLGGISGFATMLARDLKDNPELLDLVDQIKKGVKSLNEITTEVLAYTKPLKAKFIKLSFTDIANEMIRLISSEMDLLGLEYEVVSDLSESAIPVEIDYQMFHRILLNLLRNGFQSVKQPRKIVLGFQTRYDIFNNLFHISISDNGSGINPEDVEKLFTPFFTTKAEGTGLGLAMVKRMIEAHNGTISVDSVVGRGTIFKLSIPITHEL
ncbi:MAG: PAS domain S-box protein [Candidatus Delongbacteria bacterium]|nr:PAS domain S-box protein [Candidatus Delongbacteria bacterium]MBN2833887.1 PAS domain S-box protein [Candidatus Delongbacteria bacterium]